MNSSILDLLCEALTKNDSLSDLLCEGVKVPDGPDVFCHKLNQAIAYRKLSLLIKYQLLTAFPIIVMLVSLTINHLSLLAMHLPVLPD